MTAASCVSLAFPAGARVATGPELARDLFIVQAGRVQLCNRRLLSLVVLEAGAVFGAGWLPAGGDGLARSIQRSLVMRIASEQVRDVLLARPKLILALYRTQARCLSAIADQLEAVAYGSVDQRMAKLMLDLAGHSDSLAPITQRMLAGMLSIHRGTVAKCLAGFVRAGWLRWGYRSMHIVDRPALAEIAAGPDYRPICYLLPAHIGIAGPVGQYAVEEVSKVCQFCPLNFDKTPLKYRQINGGEQSGA